MEDGEHRLTEVNANREKGERESILGAADPSLVPYTTQNVTEAIRSHSRGSQGKLPLTLQRGFFKNGSCPTLRPGRYPPTFLPKEVALPRASFHGNYISTLSSIVRNTNGGLLLQELNRLQELLVPLGCPYPARRG